MGAAEKTTKFKLFWSFQKECRFLEEMALSGYFLSNMRLGVFYTFVKGEPKRMLYDIDRFQLSRKPTREEIQRKETFMEIAEEMGWREVTHDESLTYYFAKEYVEGEINELCNDEESRRYRAKKFRIFLQEQAKSLLPWVAVIAVINWMLARLHAGMAELTGVEKGWQTFAAVYIVFAILYACFVLKKSVTVERELSMSRQEWESLTDKSAHKKLHKLILTTRALNRFLKKQEEEGWLLSEVTALSYSFVKGENAKQVYTMDTKALTNKRRQEASQAQFKDTKDWIGINSDWVIQSVHDAESKGWTFVCALENRSIVYRGNPEETEPLNDAKYDNSLRFISLIGQYGACLLLCGAIGFAIGFCAGMFGL